MTTGIVASDPAGIEPTSQETNALSKLSAATFALAEARTLGEIKQIMGIAEAARTYARAAKLGLEAANHAAEIKLRAERKAGELLAQLERNNNGGDRHSSVFQPGILSEYTAVLTENDIAPVTAYRWQTAATVPENVFESFVDRIKRGQTELTSASVLRLASAHVTYNSGENEWYTPAEYIASAREVMGDIDLDPASSPTANVVVRAAAYYTVEDDGLSQPWSGRVWLNPPYAAGIVDQFATRFAGAISDGEIEQGIALVNNATETKWFRVLASAASAVAFPGGRVRFWKPDGSTGAPLQGQAVLNAGPNVAAFLAAFGPFGWGAKL